MNAYPPYSGQFTDDENGRKHIFALRVYFEDTDFSGLVYHARYLHFMERARSDMLRCAGIDQKAAFAENEGVYAVADLAIKYNAPAHFDDELIIQSRVLQIRAASVLIEQVILRGHQILTQAKVTAAFLSKTGRPTRQPKQWLAAFAEIMEKQHG